MESFFRKFLMGSPRGVLNWTPYPYDQPVLRFIFTIIKCNIFSWLAISPILIYAIYTKNTEVVISFRIFLMASFALFEEQARWNFSYSGDNVVKSAIIFLMLFIIFENSMYWTQYNGSINDFCEARAPSVMVHAIMTFGVCKSINLEDDYKSVAFFSLTFIHICFNYFWSLWVG